MSHSTAIIITCHNRKSKTLRSLESLYANSYSIDIYIVDDGSTDGTSEAVSNRFPKVQLIAGNSSLYWNRGMHLAWETASLKDYDFYIWLNDDVELFPQGLRELFECSETKNHQAIISGIIESNDNGEIIYGGTNVEKNLIPPNGEMNEITYMNGNVVLVPRFAFKRLGNLDPVFHHDLGDVDYGLRAKKIGIEVFTSRISVAKGERNDLCRVRKGGTTIFNRFERLYSPLGSNPIINFYFRRRHFGLANAILYYGFIHFINIIPDSLNKFLFKERYK